MNGVINIYKNTGMTSFDVVAMVRRVAKMKKVGHTGTLDPAASGVLPVCLGKATKIIDYIMENKKVYRVNLKLGMVTDTYDLEGEVLREEDASHITKDEILNGINSFVGTIDQVPPMYSALKQNGVRLYELARQGIEVHREARKVTIYSIENIKIDKITKEYLVEIKKSDSDYEAVKWQILFYLKVLKSKGLNRKGKIEFVEKKKNKIFYEELDDEKEKKLGEIESEIKALLESKYPPKVDFDNKCKKCAYYEYCYI